VEWAFILAEWQDYRLDMGSCLFAEALFCRKSLYDNLLLSGNTTTFLLARSGLQSRTNNFTTNELCISQD